MPWKECHVMDERLRFVTRLLEAEKMAPLCAQFGTSRKTGYKIFERYKNCGLGAFTDRSRRPEPGLAWSRPQRRRRPDLREGRREHHWRRAFGSALLLSAISAGVQLSQPRQTSLLGVPSAGQVAPGALVQELWSVALELLRRGMSAPPTLTIRQGHPFDVFLNGDLVFDGPCADRPDSTR